MTFDPTREWSGIQYDRTAERRYTDTELKIGILLGLSLGFTLLSLLNFLRKLVP